MKIQGLVAMRCAVALGLLAAALVVLSIGVGCGFSDPDEPKAAPRRSSSSPTHAAASVSTPARSAAVQPARSRVPLPPEVRRALIRARQAEATEEYAPTPGRGPQRNKEVPSPTKDKRTVHFHSVNPARDNVASYTDEGVQVARSVAGSKPIEMRLQRWGRPGALLETRACVPRLSESTALNPSEDAKKQIEYVHEHGLSEWYLNGPHGLEQGFTLTEKPAGNGPLTFDVAMAGQGVTLALGRQPNTVDLHTGPQVIVGQYGDLFAEDATGKLIAASLTLVDGGVRITVDDEAARYPLVVDPTVWLWEAKLVDVQASPGGPDVSAEAAFGSSVAVDGDVLVVGAPGIGSGGAESGAAYVFHRAAGQWVIQQKLTATLPDGTPDTRPRDRFGVSVAVSGSTLVIGSDFGGSNSNTAPGAAYVFVLRAGRWVPQSKLTAQLPDGSADPEEGNWFGLAVAVSGDVVVVGSPDNDTSRAAAYLFSRSAEQWRLQARIGAHLLEDTAEYYVPDDHWGSNFASSVAMDKDTLVLGAPDDSAHQYRAGALYIFTRLGANWDFTQKVVAHLPGGMANARAGDQFGGSVALQGSTLVAAGDGFAFVFVRADGHWTFQSKLIAHPTAAPILSGSSGNVALAKDRLLFGTTDPDGQNSSTYLFERTGSTWTVLRELDGSSVYGPAVVALSSDTLVVADPEDSSLESHAGIVRVFEAGAKAAQVLNAEQPYAVPDGDEDESFGSVLAMDGDTLVVGNRLDAEFLYSGSVSVFVRDGSSWSLQQKLGPQLSDGQPDVEVGAGFGEVLTISADTLVVGNQNSGDAGAAYVYVRVGSAWEIQQKLVAESQPGVVDDEAVSFGRAVALAGDLLVVGSGRDDGTGSDTWQPGRAYVFERDGAQWTLRQQLAAELSDGVVDPDPPTAFGASVAVSETSIVVGCSWDPLRPGVVYVYEPSDLGWSMQQQLTAAESANGSSESQESDGFGSQLALSDDALAVGSLGSPVFVFRHSNGAWSFRQKLEPDPTVADALFMGGGLAFSGGVLAVGLFDLALELSVAVFMEHQGEWTAIETFGPHAWGGIAATSDTIAVGGEDEVFIYRAQQTVSAGDACRYDAECESGPCLGGVCCEDACEGPCRSCAEALTGEADGACAPLPEETRCGDDPLSCASSHSYALAPRCDGDGACKARSAKCSDGYACVSNALGGACVSECAAHDHCVESHWCDSVGSCRADRDGGDECSFDEQCSSNDCADGGCRKDVGKRCTLDSECAHDRNCVDGYCCNSPCGGQCEACDVEGVEGRCSAVEGAPHGGRTQCRSTDATCAGSCDGQSRDGCSYPGAATSCGEAYCSEAVAYPQVCDGTGSCALGTRDACAPFGCNEDRTACAKKCSQDGQCAAGAACDRDAGECVFTGATCADSFTVELANGDTHFCEGYRCVGAGSCQESCGDDRDCHPDFACVEGKCSSDPGGKGKDSDGGCGCTVPGKGTPRGAPWWLMSLFFALWLLRLKSTSMHTEQIRCSPSAHKTSIERAA